MTRHLLNLLTALSLVCVGLVAWAWHRSYAGVDSVIFNGAAYTDGPLRRATTTAICSFPDRVWVFRFWDSEGVKDAEFLDGLELTESPDVEVWLAEDPATGWFPSAMRLRSRNLPLDANVSLGPWGFGMTRASRGWTVTQGIGSRFSRSRHSERMLTLVAPFWSLALAASILPTVRLARRLCRVLCRRARPGGCGQAVAGGVG